MWIEIGKRLTVKPFDGVGENRFSDNGISTLGTEIDEITMSEENYSSSGFMNGGGMRGGPRGMAPR